jgi:hypothetical protein
MRPILGALITGKPRQLVGNFCGNGLLALLLLNGALGCGPKQRCVKEFLFVDYHDGEPDTVYTTHCTPLNAP